MRTESNSSPECIVRAGRRRRGNRVRDCRFGAWAPAGGRHAARNLLRRDGRSRFDAGRRAARATIRARRFGSPTRIVARTRASAGGPMRSRTTSRAAAKMPAPPMDIRGTPFQFAVWEQLRAIPAGETRSYSEIARRIGRPRAIRAVGTANGANPVSIVIPCHRAIRASGHLGGYRWGLDRKRKLLEMEARRPNP